MKGMPLPPEVVEIARRLTDAGHETWCVGGAVRDWLMGRDDHDVDLATAATPEQVQGLFRRTVPVGIKYGTVGVLDPAGVLHEVTTFRKDVLTDGRHAVVAYGVSIDEDLQRRDFTINALGYHPFTQELRDPHGGRRDLDAGVIRAVGEPARRFEEDYLRILRMVRFAARFEFRIDPATWEAAVAAAPGLAGLSAERIREEWFKGLRSVRDPSRFVALWQDVGASAHWLPELVGTWPFARPLPDPHDPVVLTAGLCREPAAVLRRLRASNEEISRAAGMAAGPGAPAGPGPAGVRRWLAAVGTAADDLLLLARYRSGNEAPWAGEVARIRSAGEAVSRGQLAVTGDDLLRAGVPAGPALGRALERLLDAVLEDPALNRRERLIELARGSR